MAKVCAFLLFVTMNDENIIFEEVAPDGQQTQPSAVFKSPIPGNYTDLFTELKEKCDPAHFMHPYDPEKVDKSNTIYSELLAANPNDMGKMKEFRRRAMDELGIKFATKKLFETLITICNPENITGEFYDPHLLNIANAIYPQILENADNIIVLEDLLMQSTGLVHFMKHRNAILGARLQAQQQQMAERKRDMEAQEARENLMMFILIGLVGICMIGMIISAIFSKN